MKIALRILLFLTVAAVAAKAAPAQISLQVSGTPHGVESTWTASTPGTNPVAGYNLFRCNGTCLATATTWVQENTSAIVPTNYLDPASNGFTNGNTYSYVVQAVDTKGNLSPVSNVATVTVPTTGFPTNPSAPTITSTVQ